MNFTDFLNYLKLRKVISKSYRKTWKQNMPIYIFPKAEFQSNTHQLLGAGWENKLMFGTDNGDIKLIVENFNFVTAEQKEKILYKNAEGFFREIVNMN